MNQFVELGGFNVFLNLLRVGNYRPSDEEISADKSKAETEMLPLESIVDLLSSFVNCEQLLVPEFAKNFVEQVQTILKERLMGMRDNEIKELDKDSLASFLKSFKCFLPLSKNESEIAEIIENI